MRVRLEFEDGLQPQHQLQMGLQRCWYAVPQTSTSMRELSQELVKGFSLGVSCSSELQLRLDGFTLPAGSNPSDMLREGDLLVVTRLSSNAGQVVPAATKQNQQNAIKQVATAAQPGPQQQPNGGPAQPQGARQQTPAGEGRKQKRKAAAAGLLINPASPLQRSKGNGQSPLQQPQGNVSSAAASLKPPSTAAPTAVNHAAAKDNELLSTADVAGPSGSAALDRPSSLPAVAGTPATAGASSAAAEEAVIKTSASRSARRKAAKRLLIRTGVLPHKRKQGDKKGAADKTTTPQLRSERPAKQPRVAVAANGTAPPTTAAKNAAKPALPQSPVKTHQPSALEAAAAACPWDPNSSLLTNQQPTTAHASPHTATAPKPGGTPGTSKAPKCSAGAGGSSATASKPAAASQPVRQPTLTLSKPTKLVVESSSEEDTSSSEEESSSSDEDDDDDESPAAKPTPGSSAAATSGPRASASTPAPTAHKSAADAGASSSSDSDESDSDDSDEDDGDACAAAAASAAAAEQQKARGATAPQVLPGPPPGGPNRHQQSASKGVATVVGKATSSTHTQQQNRHQQQQSQGAVGSSSYQAHGHDYGSQHTTVTPVRMGWPPAPRAAHPSTLPKVLADSLRPGDVVVYQLLEIAANFCPQVSAWRHGRVSVEQGLSVPGEGCSTVTLDPYPDAKFHPIQRQLDEWRLQQAADAGAELAGPLDWDALPFETPYHPDGTLTAAADSFVDLRMVETAPVDPSSAAAAAGGSSSHVPGDVVVHNASTSTKAAVSSSIIPTSTAGGWSEIHDQLQQRRREVAAANGGTPASTSSVPAVNVPTIQIPTIPASAKKATGRRGGKAANNSGSEAPAAECGEAPTSSSAPVENGLSGAGVESDIGPSAVPVVSGAEVPGVVRTRGGSRRSAVGPFLQMLRSSGSIQGGS